MTDVHDPFRGIEDRLFDIPEAKFVEIVRLLEQIGDHPRVRETFSTIRPRLAVVRPHRRLTLKRIFCDPFEDVLEAARIDDAPVGRVRRDVIDPLWQVVEERADARHLRPLNEQVRRAAPDDANARHTIGCRLWYVAATVLRQILADAERNPRAASALGGGGERLREAREVAEFLEIGHPIAELKRKLPPKPILALEPEDVAAIEEAVKEVARTSPGKPYYLLLVVASRLRRPADLLAVLGDMDFGAARRKKPEVFAALSALVVSSLEDHSARADDADRLAEDPAAAVAMAEQLVGSLESTRAVMDLVNDPQYDARLDTVRDAVRGMVQTSVLAPAPTRILASLPPAPVANAPVRPPDDDAQEQAESHARALRRCQGFAGALDLDHAVTQTLTAIGEAVEARVDSALTSAAHLAPGTADADAVEQGVNYAIRLVELVAGSAQADELRLKALRAFDPDFDA